MVTRKKKKAEKQPAPRAASRSSGALPADGFAADVVRELNQNKDVVTPAQLLGSNEMAIKIRGIISTQCPGLDVAIGRGGVPLGRTTMLHGWEGSGKTTLALHCVAEAQQQGGVAVYLDTEYKLDRDYAAGIGVDIDHLAVAQPPHLEAAFQMIEQIILISRKYRQAGNPVPFIIVLDSIDSTKAKAVIEGKWDDQHVAAEPRVWSDKFPKLVPLLSREDVALLLVSQQRAKIGVLFGKKDKTSGGNAPRFYCSLLMGVERIGSYKEQDDKVDGNETRVYVGKNQIAPPFRSAEFRILYGKGVDFEDSLLREALKQGVVEQNGAWYSFDSERIGQGKDNAVGYVRGNDEVRELILARVRGEK